MIYAFNNAFDDAHGNFGFLGRSLLELELKSNEIYKILILIVLKTGHSMIKTYKLLINFHSMLHKFASVPEKSCKKFCHDYSQYNSCVPEILQNTETFGLVFFCNWIENIKTSGYHFIIHMDITSRICFGCINLSISVCWCCDYRFFAQCLHGIFFQHSMIHEVVHGGENPIGIFHNMIIDLKS